MKVRIIHILIYNHSIVHTTTIDIKRGNEIREYFCAYKVISLCGYLRSKSFTPNRTQINILLSNFQEFLLYLIENCIESRT